MPLSSIRRATRRSVLRRAAVGAAVLPAGGLISACSDEKPPAAAAPGELTNTGGADNPFGVDGSAGLDVVIFNGGYGDRYAAEGHEVLYKNKFPDAAVNHLAIVEISELVKPLLSAARPPDVVNNSGAHQVPPEEMKDKGQLLDLTLLLDAPSADDPNVKVRDTLRPGIVADGSFGGDKMYMLFYSYSASGLWYDAALFADRGWKVPGDWSEFTDLCGQIRAQGISPFVFQGKYPYYLLEPFVTLAVRHGGRKVADDMDALSPTAWTNDSVREAAEAWYQLGESGYIYRGAATMSHTEAQDFWCNGDAAFVPCGSWLENEQREKTPPAFKMSVMGPPALPGSSAPGMVFAGGDEAFIVPAQARNPAGGLEYLRLMLSKEGSRQFSSRVASLTAVKSAEGGLDSPGVQSTASMLKKAGDDVYSFKFDKLYRTYSDEVVGPAILQLMVGRMRPAEFTAHLQDATDTLRKKGTS